MDKEEHDQIGLDIKNGFIDSEMAPLKCRGCGSKEDLKENNHVYEGPHLCELSVDCYRCGKMAGYWAYGSWQV